MTNTNSYDCSYDEKPVLEGIMDILRFMDGWTKKIPDRGYQSHLVGRTITISKEQRTLRWGQDTNFLSKR